MQISGKLSAVLYQRQHLAEAAGRYVIQDSMFGSYFFFFTVIAVSRLAF